MDKKKELEMLLDIELQDWLVEDLKVYWKAFYKEPFKYRGTIVVPMVKQYIEEKTRL